MPSKEPSSPVSSSAVIVPLLLLLAVVIAMPWPWPAEEDAIVVEPGELITEPGRYRSTDSRLVLLLEPVGDGSTMNVGVTAFEGQDERCASSWQIDASTPWMFVVGSDRKVWGYAADAGVHHWQMTENENRFTTAGPGGGWAGIPRRFLEQLPEEQQQVYAAWDASQSGTNRSGDASDVE